MPRGIPKDPTARNQKKTAVHSEAPKKRGRPPGSKNTTKVAAAPKPITKAVSSFTAGQPKKPVQTVFDYANSIDIVRANIEVLATCGPVGEDALVKQIETLMHLTSESIDGPAPLSSNEEASPSDRVVTAQTMGSSVQTAAPLPSPPNFMPPPFPPHLPGQS